LLPFRIAEGNHHFSGRGTQGRGKRGGNVVKVKREKKGKEIAAMFLDEGKKRNSPTTT